MRYACEFPGCSYETNTRSHIHKHHIVPCEISGDNSPFNEVWLCPTHHSKVFIPTATSGIHTIKAEDSIIIKRWVFSTAGLLLEYMTMRGETKWSPVLFKENKK